MAKARHKDNIQDKPLPRCKECSSTDFEVVHTDHFDFQSETDAAIKYDRIRWQKVRCKNCSQIGTLRSFLYKGDQVEGESVQELDEEDRD